MKYESAEFWTPDLSILAEAMQQGLEGHYAEVDVSVVVKRGIIAFDIGAEDKGVLGQVFVHSPPGRFGSAPPGPMALS